MNTVPSLAAAALALGLAVPAFAGSFGAIDLPHLTFPTTAPAPVTQGTGQPLALGSGN